MKGKGNKSTERGYRVVQEEGKITWQVEELWDSGVVRGPFGTREFAIRREQDIARDEGFIDDLVLEDDIGEAKSPCESFEKDSEGNWHCTSAIDFEIENRMIVIGEGMTFTAGVPYMGVDVAAWLDENCS